MVKNIKSTDGGWIDISQPLNNEIAHWPEDTPFSYETSLTKEQTGSVNIGKITTSTHIGTHIDAPFHFLDDGARVLDLDINIYIGRCRVIDISSFTSIDRKTLSNFDLEGISRLLIKTSVPNNPQTFPDKIPYITKSGAEYLGGKSIKLVGVDVPSVDALNSKELEGHHTLFKNGIHILENLMLDGIAPGEYELIALPLPIERGDGSPVRAVVRAI